MIFTQYKAPFILRTNFDLILYECLTAFQDMLKNVYFLSFRT